MCSILSCNNTTI